MFFEFGTHMFKNARLPSLHLGKFTVKQYLHGGTYCFV